MKSSWQRQCETSSGIKEAFISYTPGHILMLCRTAHTYSPYQTPLFTSGTHCCAGLLQGSGKHLVAGLMVPGLGKITAHTEPSGAVVARLQTRQRAHACIPYTQKYTFQLGGSWSHKKAPLFAPDSHEES